MVYWSESLTVTLALWVPFLSKNNRFLSVQWRVKVAQISVIPLLAEITVHTNLNIRNLPM
jgi:hypothetical protein